MLLNDSYGLSVDICFGAVTGYWITVVVYEMMSLLEL